IVYKKEEVKEKEGYYTGELHSDSDPENKVQSEEPGPAAYLAQTDEQEEDDDNDVFVEVMEELPEEDNGMMIREELPTTSNEEVE
ncbi:10231_t:CDS:1, partial [Acaulospora morrowiae]